MMAGHEEPCVRPELPDRSVASTRPAHGASSFSSVFVVLVVTSPIVFHELMAREGQTHSWATGFYWTLVTMTTLGFGDITFTSDLGRIFSVVVLLTGTAFLLILLPFAFIQFVFVPWMNRRDASRAPRSLPEETSGHLVLTRLGPIEDALIRRAEQAGVEYVVLVADLSEALQLHDQGYRVMVGSSDDPATHRAARWPTPHWSLRPGPTRPTPTSSSLPERSRPMFPSLRRPRRTASIDILELAGADDVLRLGQLARLVHGRPNTPPRWPQPRHRTVRRSADRRGSGCCHSPGGKASRRRCPAVPARRRCHRGLGSWRLHHRHTPTRSSASHRC